MVYILYTTCRNSYIQHGKNVAKALDCPTEPSWAMVECLQKVDNIKLLQASNQADLLSGRPFTERWYPVVDGEFLVDVPYQLYKEGYAKGVEFMHGIGQHDAGHFLMNWLQRPEGDEDDKTTLYKYWHKFYRYLISFIKHAIVLAQETLKFNYTSRPIN